MTIHVDGLSLADASTDDAAPTDQFPRRNPDEADPKTVPELEWRGTQEWICGFVAAWPDADGWYVLDWGDGTSSIAHSAMRIRRHSYTTHSACDNITGTVEARPLHRDGTTGPVAARSTVQARGWGKPQHEFRVFDSDPRRVFANLFRQEPPLGYGIAWDPDTVITQLPDGESSTEHMYDTGPPRQPQIGVLDRPARRLRWFTGPTINREKKKPSGSLTAWFGVTTEWDGGYSGEFHVANHTDKPLSWHVDFDIGDPAVPREVWPMPTAHMRQLRNGRWRVWSTKPVPANNEATVGMRVEPCGSPTHWPDNLEATEHHDDE